MDEENWDDYRFALALLRAHSVAGAARLLNVNETTVARRLTHLERSLGTRLFERARGRTEPTDAGRALIARLARIDDELRALRDEAAGLDLRVAGPVRITAVPMIANRVIVPRLAELLDEHDQLQIELVADSSVLSIANAREADIAIRGLRPDSDPAAITRKLGDMQYGVYCHRSFIDTGTSPGWLAYEHRNGHRPQGPWIEQQLAAEGSTARATCNDAETLLQSLLTGLGKSLLPDALALQYPELVKLEVADSTPSRELWMLMHPSYREVRRIEIVANWLAGTVQDFLGSANNPPDNAEATR